MHIKVKKYEGLTIYNPKGDCPVCKMKRESVVENIKYPNHGKCC
jgi:hypothetical protein